MAGGPCGGSGTAARGTRRNCKMSRRFFVVLPLIDRLDMTLLCLVWTHAARDMLAPCRSGPTCHGTTR
jgi:hypothetical protein